MRVKMAKLLNFSKLCGLNLFNQCSPAAPLSGIFTQSRGKTRFKPHSIRLLRIKIIRVYSVGNTF